MVALRSTFEDSIPRTPFALADQFRDLLRTRSPKRFAGVNVRVANGAVAITGQVPNWQSKELVLKAAQLTFMDTRVIDALEVQNRRTFAARSSAA